MTAVVTNTVRFGPGEEARAPAPGDFGLTHGHGFIPCAIRWGQAREFRGERRPFAHWNHAFAVVDADGTIVEATGRGVESNNLSKYAGSEYHLAYVEASPEDRAHMAEFALSCVGRKYGYLTIASIAVEIVTGMHVAFEDPTQLICSALVAEMLERAGWTWPFDTSFVFPAHLAERAGIKP